MPQIQKHPEFRMTPVDNLIPYARNARTHSDEQVAQIAASISAVSYTHLTLPTTSRV